MRKTPAFSRIYMAKIFLGRIKHEGKKETVNGAFSARVAGFSAAGSLALSVSRPCRGSVGRVNVYGLTDLNGEKVYRDGLETRERKLDGRQF